jgi:hypothetical protein
VNTNYLDPKDINQGLEIMPIFIAQHSTKPHLTYLPKVYSHKLESSPCIYPWLVKKIGGQVGASITMLSIQIAHVLCMERKTLPIPTRDFQRRCILMRFKDQPCMFILVYICMFLHHDILLTRMFCVLCNIHVPLWL